MGYLIMLVLMFLMLGGFFIVSQENLFLIKKEDLSRFGSLYFMWIDKIARNIGGISGAVIQVNWMPKNLSSFSE